MTGLTRHLALCLDPVHVGTGGYRLGRVDLSIVREPSTGIPKIPGTSLHGAVRAYAEMLWDAENKLQDIKKVFGTAEGDQGYQGMVRFYDADIVLFPVSSHVGTVWVSTGDRLTQWFGLPDLTSTPADENKVVAVQGLAGKGPVHLGWLLLEREATPGNLQWQGGSGLEFVKRVAVVSHKVFHHLANDHLEVRTSVSIDDDTGAAESGLLFTYEAIPRGAVVGFEMSIDRRRGSGITEDTVATLMRSSFGVLESLGVGGMGTRGFGRLRVLKG